jgi:hypothetical protein
MNGGYPLRPVASARTRPVADIAAQPGGCQRPRPAPRPTAVARLRSADQLLAPAVRRSAALVTWMPAISASWCRRRVAACRSIRVPRRLSRIGPRVRDAAHGHREAGQHAP